MDCLKAGKKQYFIMSCRRLGKNILFLKMLVLKVGGIIEDALICNAKLKIVCISICVTLQCDWLLTWNPMIDKSDLKSISRRKDRVWLVLNIASFISTRFIAKQNIIIQIFEFFLFLVRKFI